MPRHEDTRVLPYAPEDMYALVADVARYPEFLPWCTAARIRARRVEGEGEARREIIDADLVISFKVFRESFGSRVVLSPGRIDTEYLDGPFRYLRSQWNFAPAEPPAGAAPGTRACRIHFWVDFEFRSRILQGVVGLVFDEAMQRIVRAFEARAKAVYG